MTKMYTPRLYPTFSITKQITPILKSKQGSISRKESSKVKPVTKIDYSNPVSARVKNLSRNKPLNNQSKSTSVIKKRNKKSNSSLSNGDNYSNKTNITENVLSPAENTLINIGNFLKETYCADRKPMVNHQRKSNPFKLQKASKTSFVNPFNTLREETPRNADLIPSMVTLNHNLNTYETNRCKGFIEREQEKRDLQLYHTEDKSKCSQNKQNSKSPLKTLVQKYKPNTSCQFTPIRKSSRNNSMTGISKTSLSNIKQSVKLDASPNQRQNEMHGSVSPKKVKPSPIAETSKSNTKKVIVKSGLATPRNKNTKSFVSHTAVKKN